MVPNKMESGSVCIAATDEAAAMNTVNIVPDAELAAWHTSRLTALYQSNRFYELAVAIEDGHAARDPRVVNWCIDIGYRTGAVPVLQHLTQNMLRYKSGRVPTLEDLEFGMRCAGLLLLRVAQDVLACKHDLGKSDRGGIYEKFRSMTCHYVLRWPAEVRPLPRVIVPALTAWLETSSSKMPLPTWATSFGLGIFSVTYYWQAPTEEDTLALCRAASHVNETRTAVATKFIHTLSAATSWDAFLMLDLNVFEPECAQ